MLSGPLSAGSVSPAGDDFQETRANIPERRAPEELSSSLFSLKVRLAGSADGTMRSIEAL